MFMPTAPAGIFLILASVRYKDITGRLSTTMCRLPNQATAPRLLKKIIYHDVKVPSKFGALAFSEKSGHIGGALNQNSKAEAQNAAIRQCEKGSRNAPCKAISWVRNGCIAAASGKLKNQTKVIGGAAEPGLAEQAAITNCKNAGMTECKVLMPEGCSLPQLQ